MTSLVLVHGFMGGSAQWLAQIAAFSKTYDVIAVDLPGFGANNHLPTLDSISAFAEWVVAELKLRGVERYHLLGHSMGGMIVQEMARMDHDHIERLVLYGTGAVGVLPGRFETIEESKARTRADGATATARRISATWFLDRENAPEEIQAGLDAMQGWRGADLLQEIKPETLVIWGDGDRTYPWQQTQLLWNAIPQARLAVVPNCAHAVHLEMAAVFNLIVAGFLTR